MHDALIKLLFYHLVVSKAFFAYSQFSLDISVSLTSSTFKLVVFTLKAVHFRSEGLVLNLDFFN